MHSPPHLIFVSMEDWDEIWRRNQFVCAELLKRHPGMKILFVGLPRDVSHAVRTGRREGIAKPAVWTQECGSAGPGCDLAQNTAGGGCATSSSALTSPSALSTRHSALLVAHPLKLFPNTLALGRKVNEWMMRRQVRKLARRMGLRRPLLWLNPHYAVHLVGRMDECGVVYDITDDWTNLKQRKWLMKLIQKQDAELCRRADAVIVCSKRLFEMKRGMAGGVGDKLHLIPNGVDAEHYRTVLDGTGELPERARAWKKPVLGYTGTIHPDRVDVGLVEAIARKMAEATIVMIGPVMLSDGDLTRLKSCGNVILTGPVAYGELPNYMRAFDVCITPHCRSEFTESLNPIKLWEYLAAGKPIVATDVAGFRDYPKLVRIADGADGFVEAVRGALGEDWALAEARRAEAGRHSWGKRVEEMERVLSGEW